jgi:NDP-sugar pyrophosphorylase family protein
MKAMVLAAGLGTRLRPLTEERPKALVEIGGRTLLEITLTRLRAFGIREAIVNVHHFADMVVEYLKAKNNFGMRIEVSREDVLLDTGGGLKKAGWFFLEETSREEEPFLLHNVDVISTIDLHRMVQWHKENKALAALAVQEREASRYLLFNEQLQLRGRRAGNNQPDELLCGSREAQALAFTGVHVISPQLLRLIKEEGAFSIIDLYLRLAGQGQNVIGFRADNYYWRDLGRFSQIQQAAEDYKQKLFV